MKQTSFVCLILPASESFFFFFISVILPALFSQTSQWFNHFEQVMEEWFYFQMLLILEINAFLNYWLKDVMQGAFII